MASTLIVAVLVGLAFAFFAGAVVYSAMKLKDEVPEEDREFMDPLPRILRLIWPVVRFVDYHVCGIVPDALLSGPAEALKLSGLFYIMNPRQFLAVCLVSSVGMVFFMCVFLSFVDMFNWYLIFGISAVAFVYPRIWLKETLKRRRKLIVKALPTYLDFLTMGVEAGLNMAGAITQAVAKGPAGPFKQELALVLRDLRAGLTRTEALKRMDDRVRVAPVSSFVSAVVQAERMGASLGQTFRFQAEQRRTERFQLAEKLAMEAPVKLIFPLVVFIFPVTFIVLLFPIVMKFLESGVVGQ